MGRRPRHKTEARKVVVESVMQLSLLTIALTAMLQMVGGDPTIPRSSILGGEMLWHQRIPRSAKLFLSLSGSAVAEARTNYLAIAIRELGRQFLKEAALYIIGCRTPR